MTLPPHPCTIPDYIPSTVSNIQFTFRKKLFFLLAELLPLTYPFDRGTVAKKNCSVHYFEFRGQGKPPDDIGTPGDVWIDATPSSLGLYVRMAEEWSAWPASNLQNKVFVAHPHIPWRYLWCTPRAVIWYHPNSINNQHRHLKQVENPIPAGTLAWMLLGILKSGVKVAPTIGTRHTCNFGPSNASRTPNTMVTIVSNSASSVSGFIPGSSVFHTGGNQRPPQSKPIRGHTFIEYVPRSSPYSFWNPISSTSSTLPIVPDLNNTTLPISVPNSVVPADEVSEPRVTVSSYPNDLSPPPPGCIPVSPDVSSHTQTPSPDVDSPPNDIPGANVKVIPDAVVGDDANSELTVTVSSFPKDLLLPPSPNPKITPPSSHIPLAPVQPSSSAEAIPNTVVRENVIPESNVTVSPSQNNLSLSPPGTIPAIPNVSCQSQMQTPYIDSPPNDMHIADVEAISNVTAREDAVSEPDMTALSSPDDLLPPSPEEIPASHDILFPALMQSSYADSPVVDGPTAGIGVMSNPTLADVSRNVVTSSGDISRCNFLSLDLIRQISLNTLTPFSDMTTGPSLSAPPLPIILHHTPTCHQTPLQPYLNQPSVYLNQSLAPAPLPLTLSRKIGSLNDPINDFGKEVYQIRGSCSPREDLHPKENHLQYPDVELLEDANERHLEAGNNGISNREGSEIAQSLTVPFASPIFLTNPTTISSSAGKKFPSPLLVEPDFFPHTSRRTSSGLNHITADGEHETEILENGKNVELLDSAPYQAAHDISRTGRGFTFTNDGSSLAPSVFDQVPCISDETTSLPQLKDSSFEVVSDTAVNQPLAHCELEHHVVAGEKPRNQLFQDVTEARRYIDLQTFHNSEQVVNVHEEEFDNEDLYL